MAVLCEKMMIYVDDDVDDVPHEPEKTQNFINFTEKKVSKFVLLFLGSQARKNNKGGYGNSM